MEKRGNSAFAFCIFKCGGSNGIPSYFYVIPDLNRAYSIKCTMDRYLKLAHITLNEFNQVQKSLLVGDTDIVPLQ